MKLSLVQFNGREMFKFEFLISIKSFLSEFLSDIAEKLQNIIAYFQVNYGRVHEDHSLNSWVTLNTIKNISNQN